MNDAFVRYHPFVIFLYFTVVLAYCICFMHPLFLMISLFCAFMWAFCLNKKQFVRFCLAYILPFMCISVLFNIAFNHAGATILTYLPDGNPLTLESIIYGGAAAMLLAAVVTWFSCFNQIMTADKFVYLFGKIMPSLSLVLALALRFVPKFKAQMKTVQNAQRCLGRSVSSGTVWQRVCNAAKILSIMVTWALEDAIETADSMKSRGYGLSGRTAFSIYRFDRRDRVALFFICTVGLYILCTIFQGSLYFRYFPFVRLGDFTVWSGTAIVAYFGLCMLPIGINRWEDRKWTRIKSNI